jgi:menaquinone-specific isochorismate synthase
VTGARERLTARTTPVDEAPDLVAFAGTGGLLFEHAGAGLAGRGVAARVPWSALDRVLAAIEVHDDVGRPGTGALAFAALPFRPHDDAEAIVPCVVAGRDEDGTAWRTTIADERAGAAPPVDGSSVPGTSTGGAEPSSFSVRPTRPPHEWCEAVAEATRRIRSGRLDKVVLAREVVVTTDVAVSRPALLRRLLANYGGCYVFSVDGFVGASPELLVERRGDLVRAHPMAGTTPRTGDPAADARLAAALVASAKMRVEHQITIDMVHDTLLPWCSYLDYEAEPSVAPVANVQHLATMVEGRLSSPAPSVRELVGALHPTPAVCGWPRPEALALIDELEGGDRGRYAGTVGWVDGQGNGTWAVGIRCAELDGTTARLWAGNGIVADSDPAAELAETRAKLQALLSVLVQP